MSKLNLPQIRLIITNYETKKSYQQVLNKQINLSEIKKTLIDLKTQSKSFTSVILDIND